MRVPRRMMTAAVAAAAIALLPAAAAQADIVAAYDHAVPGQGTDIALLDVSTGQRLPLPAGVNTTSNEAHPSLSADAGRLIFERNGSLVTQQLRPLGPPVGEQSLPGFAPLLGPDLSPGGQRSIHGRGSLLSSGAVLGTANIPAQAIVESGVPGEPISRVLSLPGAPLGAGTAGASIDDGTNPLMAWSTSRAGTFDIDEVQTTLPGLQGDVRRIAGLLGTPTTAYLHAEARFGAVNFTRATIANGQFGNGDLGTLFGTAGSSLYPSGSPSDPTKINTPLDEHVSSFTGDGRYMGFFRRAASGNDTLQVFDNQSQRLINPGIDLGADPVSNARYVQKNLSLAIDPTRFSITCQTLGNCFRTLPGLTGLQVFRITGTHTLRGKRVPRLELVGVQKLGREPRRFGVRPESIRIGGKPLAPGRYLVFVRARTDDDKRVRDLSRGIRVTVR